MAETLRDLGVVVDHPADERLRGRRRATSSGCSCRSRRRPRCGPASSSSGRSSPRFGRVIISNPGGDRIGRRPVNLHVDAMRALGAEIEYRNGYYFAKAPGRLRGGEIALPVRVRSWARRTRCSPPPSPTATRSIRPAAQEPEVDDLIAFLQKMGAEVERTAPDTIEVEGRRRLRGADHRVVPDRIEAGTFVVAAAVTGGQVTLEGAPCEHLEAFLDIARPGRGRRVACDADTIEVDGDGLGRRLPGVRHRDRALPGPRDRPPAADLRAADPGRRARRTSTRRSSRTASSGSPSSRRMGAEIDIADAHHATIHGPTPPARRRGRDRRPARRRVADPRRAGRRRHVDDPRRAPRSPGV